MEFLAFILDEILEEFLKASLDVLLQEYLVESSEQLMENFKVESIGDSLGKMLKTFLEESGENA